MPNLENPLTHPKNEPASWWSLQCIVLVALCLFVFCTGLGNTHLWDDDETYFAQVAKEMLQRDDWIVPWFNQELFSHKPPVMYWGMMGAYRVFGVNEFAARLPAAIFGLANVLLVWRVGNRLFSGRAGFYAGLILATSLNFVVIARAAACDSELTFFTMLAVHLYLRGCSLTRYGLADWNRQPRWTTWAVVYAAMGAAVMTKGPIGLLLPGCVIGLHRIWCAENTRSAERTETAASTLWQKFRLAITWNLRSIAPWRLFNEVWQMRPFLAIAMILLVAGPWFALVAWKTDGEFLVGFFGTHHFHRFTAGMDNHAGPVWFYLAAICVGFFPWIIFLRSGIEEVIRKLFGPRIERQNAQLLIAWLIVWVGFFSIATTKFPHYVVPAYPALALMTGTFLSQWEKRFELLSGFPLRLAWGTLIVVGVGLIVVPTVVARRLQIEATGLWIPGLPVLASAFGMWFFARRREVVHAVTALSLMSALFLVILFANTAAEIDRAQSTVALAQRVSEATQNDPVRLATWRFFRPGLIYYATSSVETGHIPRLEDPASVSRWLAASTDPSFVIARADELHTHRAALPVGLTEIARTPWFLKANHELVLLRFDPTQTAARETQTQ